MKKILYISISLYLLLITGCSRVNEKSVVSDLNKKISNLNGYHMTGNLTIYSGDNTYRYKVESSYEDDNYRVTLINKTNNHEQIILKNDDGVYVLTPALNKNYKFQSSWPENSSQIYVLQSLLNDINKDKNIKLIKNKNGYILESKIYYSNNRNLVKEKIYMDKDLKIKKIEVYDKENNLQMKFDINEIDTKATFNKKYFKVSENMKSSTEETKQTISEIDSPNYPMYLPSGTYLENEESVSMEDKERIILTFEGESPFILVQETVNVTDEKEDIPVSGEPTFLLDTIGAISNNSLSFISNGIEYYLASDSLTTEQMVQVAESINPVAVMK